MLTWGWTGSDGHMGLSRKWRSHGPPGALRLKARNLNGITQFTLYTSCVRFPCSDEKLKTDKQVLWMSFCCHVHPPTTVATFTPQPLLLSFRKSVWRHIYAWMVFKRLQTQPFMFVTLLKINFRLLVFKILRFIQSLLQNKARHQQWRHQPDVRLNIPASGTTSIDLEDLLTVVCSNVDTLSMKSTDSGGTGSRPNTLPRGVGVKNIFEGAWARAGQEDPVDNRRSSAEVSASSLPDKSHGATAGSSCGWRSLLRHSYVTRNRR